MKHYLLTALLLSTSVFAETPCTSLPLEKYSRIARWVMETNDLLTGEAKLDDESGVEWRAIAIKQIEPNKCILVMNLSIYRVEAGKKNWEISPVAYEALGLTLVEGQWVSMLFERLFDVPPVAHVKITRNDEPAQSFNAYYAEMSGRSAIEVHKAYLAKIPAAGFSAEMSAIEETLHGKTIYIPDGPAPFDPFFDPVIGKRKWKVQNAQFDLRRGMSPEICDVTPGDFDYNFDETLKGAGGCIRPWGTSFLRGILEGSEWKIVVLDQALAGPPLKPVIRPTHEVVFKGPEKAEKCLRQINATGVVSNLEGIGGAPGIPPFAASFVLKKPHAKNEPLVKALACVRDLIKYGG